MARQKGNHLQRFIRRMKKYGRWVRRQILLLLVPEIIDYGYRLTAIETAYKVAAGDKIPHNWAMNGQEKRKAVTTEVIKKMNVELVVETGTYLGSTSMWLAQFGAPVFTSEISSPYYYCAKKEFEKTGLTNITAAHCDSRDLLRQLTKDGKVQRQVFIYLDAHWFSDLPLVEEIKIIDDGFADYIIMIDDFKIEGHKYGYDNYGPTKKLTINLIRGVVQKRGLKVYFPDVPYAEETGGKRGYVYLTKSTKNTQILDSIKLLRKYNI